MMNLDWIFLQLQFKSRRMDDFLFKVVNGAVEIVKSTFQAIPTEKGVVNDAVRVPPVARQTVPPLRSETVPPLRSINRAFPSQGLV